MKKTVAYRLAWDRKRVGREGYWEIVKRENGDEEERELWMKEGRKKGKKKKKGHD